MKATIKGVYTSDLKTGQEYVTKSGNIYLKLLIATEDKSVYDSIFFTEKAHWKMETFFQSCGQPVIPFSDVKAQHFIDCIGKDVDVSFGKDQNGYDNVKKYWASKVGPQDIEVRDNGTDASQDIEDKMDSYSAPEDEDDVPF